MLALRNLLRRRTRTLLTITGVAVGVSIVVALTAVARGMRSQVNSMFSGEEAHLIATLKNAADPIVSYLPTTLLDELRARPDIVAAEPVILGATQIPGRAVFIFFGTTERSPFIKQLRMIDGTLPFAQEDGVVLGAKAARAMNVKLGDKLKLSKFTFTIVGVFESATPLLDAGAMLSFTNAQETANLTGKMSSALLTITDISRDGLARTEAAVEAAHEDIEAVPPAEWAGAFEEFELAEQTALIFSILATCIGGISVMNTMLMSVFERTREFGVLQAIGWSKAMVLREVLAEALIVSLVGGPLGIALGVGVVELIGTLPDFAWVAGDYGPSLYAQAMAVGIGMGAIGSLYPAWRVLGIAPIEALRYE